MKLTIEPYCEQAKVWPRHGRHILAQFDAETVIVYQAYRPDIGVAEQSHRTRQPISREGGEHGAVRLVSHVEG
jgi:hypothetical protein